MVCPKLKRRTHANPSDVTVKKRYSSIRGEKEKIEILTTKTDHE